VEQLRLRVWSEYMIKLSKKKGGREPIPSRKAEEGGTVRGGNRGGSGIFAMMTHPITKDPRRQ